MKMRHITAGLLFGCVAASLLGGCASMKASAPDQKGKAEKNVTADVNAEGFPIVKGPITLKIFGQQGSVQGKWEDMDVLKKYQEMTNIKLDFTNVLPAEGFGEKKSLMFASNDYPDIFVRAQLGNQEIVKYGNQGVLTPLEGLIDEYAPNFKKHMEDHPEVRARITAPDGHIYSLPDIITINAARDAKIWINKAWLAKVGKDIPETVDELEEVLRAFKGVDFNGNGQADEQPLGCAAAPGELLNYFAGFWGYQHQFGQYMEVKDKTVSTYIKDDHFKDLLNWLSRMYEEGLIDPEVFTQEYSKYAAKMAGQTMGIFFNQADDAFDSTDFVGISPFKGKTDHPLYNCAPIARTNGVFAISSDCKNKEAAMRWVDYFYGKEGSIFLRYGVEGKTWNYNDAGLPEYVDGILNSPEGSGTAIGKFTIWPGGWAPQWLNEENSSAVVSEATNKAQKALDPYLTNPNYEAPLMSQERNDRLSVLENDISTYLNGSLSKFIRGELSLDSDWETYKQTLDQIGIDEWVAVYQEAFNEIQ